MPTDCERWQLRDWCRERQRWSDKPTFMSLRAESGNLLFGWRGAESRLKLNVTLFRKTQQEVDHE